MVSVITGRVLQFDQTRGYGFVAADDGGEDVFLHSSVFNGDSDVLSPGIRVEFKVMAGERGRKAFAAHLADDEPDSGIDPVPAARPTPSVMPARVPASAAPQLPDGEDMPGDAEMCDVLSPAELGPELTELLISAAPTLTGEQIVQVREAVLECARKHGWVDI